MSRIYLSPCPCRGCKLREQGCHENCKHTDLTYSEWLENSIEKPNNTRYSQGMYDYFKKVNRRNAQRREQ